jgi:hypothetical protein
MFARRKLIVLIASVASIAMVLSGCTAPTPETIEVEVTRIVEREGEVVVERGAEEVVVEKETPSATPQGVETASFVELVQQFVGEANLPVDVVRITAEEKVTEENWGGLAREIVEEMVFLRVNEAVIVNKVKDNGLSDTEVGETAENLISDGLISLDDYVVVVEWETGDGQRFQTLGTMDSTGEPKFEPILFFNGVEEATAPEPQMGNSWAWTWKHTIKNGFGSECVRVRWVVKIKCSADNCKITDPPPHVELTEAGSYCSLWEQKTAKGEVAFCSEHEGCECSKPGGQNKEDCIKWVVVTYVANGFSNLKIESGASGEIEGVKLDAKVSFEASRFGKEVTYEKIRNLCAKSG